MKLRSALVPTVLMLCAACGGSPRTAAAPASAPVAATPEPAVAEPELNRRLDEIANAPSTRCVIGRAREWRIRDTLSEVTASDAVMRIGLFATAVHATNAEPARRRAYWLDVASHFIDLGDVVTARTALARADEISLDTSTGEGAELLRRADLVRIALAEKPIGTLAYGLDDVPALVRGGHVDVAKQVVTKETGASLEDRFRAAVALEDRARMTELLAQASGTPSVLYVTWLETAIRMRGNVDEAVRELLAHRTQHAARWPYDAAIAKKLRIGRLYGFADALAPLRRALASTTPPADTANAGANVAPTTPPANATSAGANVAPRPLDKETAALLLREALVLGDTAAAAALRPVAGTAPTLEVILTRTLDEGLAAVRTLPAQQANYFMLALWARHVVTGFGSGFDAKLTALACAG